MTEFRDEDMMRSWPGGIIDAELSHWRHVLENIIIVNFCISRGKEIARFV